MRGSVREVRDVGECEGSGGVACGEAVQGTSIQHAYIPPGIV